MRGVCDLPLHAYVRSWRQSICDEVSHHHRPHTHSGPCWQSPGGTGSTASAARIDRSPPSRTCYLANLLHQINEPTLHRIAVEASRFRFPIHNMDEKPATNWNLKSKSTLCLNICPCETRLIGEEYAKIYLQWGNRLSLL